MAVSKKYRYGGSRHDGRFVMHVNIGMHYNKSMSHELLLETELGHYRPSFFFMQINTDQDFKEIFGTKYESVLVHEYIHFLQDLSTTFGLIHASFSVDFIKALAHYLLACKEEKIVVPIRLPKFREFISTNIDLFEIYFGNVKPIPRENLQVINVNFKEKPIKDGSYAPGVLEVGLGFKGASWSKKYRFGAISIMESMAGLIDEHLYPEYESSTLLPYHLAEMVSAFIYPEFSAKKINILTLCDVSLLSFNPAEMFYMLLTMMKGDKFFPSTHLDIYDYALKNIRFPSGDNTSFNLLDLLRNQSNTSKKQIAGLFTTPLVKDLAEWGGHFIHSAINQRLRKMDFISQILTMDKVSGRRYIFDRLMYEIGVPLIFNKRGICWTLYNAEQAGASPLLYATIYEVYRMLRYGKKHSECKMKLGCSSSPEPIDLDASCDRAPWERVKKDQLCLFAQIWKMWGLENKKIALSA